MSASPRPRHAAVLGTQSDTPALPGGLWLAGRAQDLALMVATPVAIIPFIAVARMYWSDEAIAMLVVAFGANAHHLPGFMRAYGDPGIRDRYRGRLILAPLVLAATCLGFAHSGLHGLTFVIVLWGGWHGLAQVYGLGRMYDAKIGGLDAFTANLDKAVCVGWFGGGLLFSPHRMNLALGELYRCGLPAFEPSTLQTIRW